MSKESKKLQQVYQLYCREKNEEGLFRQEGKQIVPVNRDLRDILMKRVLALFLVLICMLSLGACDKATGRGEPVRDGDVSDISEIDKNVSSETEQTQQAIVESISGTISHIDEDKT